MNQDENIQNIKETFNVSSENREIIPAKSYSKVKLIIAIISTIHYFNFGCDNYIINRLF